MFFLFSNITAIIVLTTHARNKQKKKYNYNILLQINLLCVSQCYTMSIKNLLDNLISQYLNENVNICQLNNVSN